MKTLNILSRISVFTFLAVSTTASLPLKEPICRFFPTNTLSYPANSNKAVSSMEKGRFDEAIALVQRIYDPVFNQKGLRLTIQADWEDASIAASATRDAQDHPIIRVAGGMARHPKMTPDGFLLVLCHEVGHFLGGAPKAFRGTSQRRSWSSVEGEADYFATAKCLKAAFPDEAENELAVQGSPLANVEKGRSFCSTALCLRIALAGQSAAHVFASVMGATVMPEPSSPDPSEVTETLPKYPSAQCRLDTFLSGALCSAPWQTGFDDIDPAVGACASPGGVPDSGARPVCWFAN